MLGVIRVLLETMQKHIKTFSGFLILHHASFSSRFLLLLCGRWYGW